MKAPKHTQNRSTLFVVLFLIISCFSKVGHPSEFRVTPTVDSDCSDLSCDFQSALAEASSNNENDTILLEEGTYDPSVSSGIFSYEAPLTELFSISIVGSGKGKTVLDGTSYAGPGEEILKIFNYNGDISLSGLTVKNGLSSGLVGLSVAASGAFILIKDCGFSNNAGGVQITAQKIPNDPPNIIQIFDSIFSNNQSNTFLNPGLEIRTAAENISIERNVFNGNIGGGMLIENSAAGGTVTLDNTLFIDNVGGAAQITVGNTPPNAGGNAFLSNNTVIDNQGANDDFVWGGILVRTTDDSSEVNFLNNIILNSSTPSGKEVADIFFDGGTDFVDDGKGSLIRLTNNNYGKLSTICFECSAQKEESGNINKETLFVDPENSDFHLSPASPCVNAGIVDDSFELPELDLDGNPRIFGSAPDMGAFELQSEPSGGSGGGSESGGCSLIK